MAILYLAVTTKLVARETLAALLWPEMAEKSAKNNLRTTLAKLNQQLGPYLDITTTSVAFNLHLPHLLDVERLRTCLDTAIPAQDLVELQRVVDLYQGEFLQGFHLRGAESFEEWMLQQREQLHLLTMRGLELLVQLYLKQGATIMQGSALADAYCT